MSRAKSVQMIDRAPKPGHLFIEVVSGVEGPCLVLGDHEGGHRLAGPKPWGGGSTVHRFEVSVDELIAEAKPYKQRKTKVPQ